MKECAVNRERAVIANHQMPEVAEPREGALDFPAPAVAPQRSSVLGHRFASIPAMRGDQFDPALSQPLSQRVTVVTTIGDQAERFLSRPPGMGSAAYADRRERRFCELRFVRGCRTKVLSQRKTLAVDHHHPLRALAPLGFSDSSAPFLAGAKLPSRKDSLHCSCFRSLSSARNARQILSQTPCSSQSRSLRQHVAGEGNSSGKSCQRAPLRRIHKRPSSTLRSEARGRPPRRRERGRGSKGRTFSHWASVNRRPYRAIGPPAALLTLFISHFRQPNYLRIQGLHPVLKQLLVTNHESPVTNHHSLLQRLQLLPINLPIRLDTPGHTHHARLIHQPAILIVSIGEEHHLIHAALIFEGDEHHVAEIFCSDVTVSHHPAAKRHALSAQTRQFVAPDFAVAWQKIQGVPAHANFQNFPLVPQLLFSGIFRRLHFRQHRADTIPSVCFGK